MFGEIFGHHTRYVCVCGGGASSGGEAGLLLNILQGTGCRSREGPSPVSAGPSLRNRFNPLCAIGV